MVITNGPLCRLKQVVQPFSLISRIVEMVHEGHIRVHKELWRDKARNGGARLVLALIRKQLYYRFNYYNCSKYSPPAVLHLLILQNLLSKALDDSFSQIPSKASDNAYRTALLLQTTPFLPFNFFLIRRKGQKSHGAKSRL